MAAPPPPMRFGPPLRVPPLDGLPREAAFMTRAIVAYLRGIQALPEDEAPGEPFTNAVRGIPAVAGCYRGVARVIRDEGEFDRLGAGEVLVCPMTSPAWSVLFERAGALVTDHGGVLSHPAVLAREYGIPAVVATRDGTRRIPDGAVVVVDGTAGIVTVETADRSSRVGSAATAVGRPSIAIAALSTSATNHHRATIAVPPVVIDVCGTPPIAKRTETAFRSPR